VICVGRKYPIAFILTKKQLGAIVQIWQKFVVNAIGALYLRRGELVKLRVRNIKNGEEGKRIPRELYMEENAS